MHLPTTSIAVCRSTLWPIETYIGATPDRVRTAAPTSSPLSMSGDDAPTQSSGVFALPTSMVFAQPMLAVSNMTPRWHAIPNRRGCALP